MTNISELNALESGIKGYKVFIDACALLSDEAELFWKNIIPILYKTNSKLIVPLSVYNEVKRFADSPAACVGKQPNLHKTAKRVANDIAGMQKEGLVDVFGDDNEPKLADNIFLTVFTRYRLKYNLMLITKDNNLSHDILALNNQRSVSSSKDICVRRITPDGFLKPFVPSKSTASSASKSKHSNTNNGNNPPSSSRFALATSVTNISGLMTISDVPTEGSTLIAEENGIRRSIRLLSKVAAGGEGTIYQTNESGVVAKIYFPRKLTKAKYEKLRLMLSKDIKCEGVCFPRAPLFNYSGEFVGYIMPQAQGKILQHCVFIPRLLEKNFPNWTKVETVQLCVTILEKISYLHSCNIILGDINPSNILVVSPTEVYLVDTDSYQIEGFPCPVGMTNYTAPEIQRKDFSTFLRSKGNEYFAVATLLFMIMLPGKTPYALQGGENQIENILRGEFAYPSGSRSSGKVPEGMWRYCWSHLPRYLKDDFYETFRKGGNNYECDKRFTSRDWLSKFKHYLDLLKNGTMANNDEMSLHIFPTRFKNHKRGNAQSKTIQCKMCGKVVSENSSMGGLCKDCAIKLTASNKGSSGSNTTRSGYTIRVCSNCHESFRVPLQGGSNSSICPKCLKRRTTPSGLNGLFSRWLGI